MVKDLRMRDKTRYAQRERERGTKNKLYSNSNRYKRTTSTTTTTFTKVTRSLYIVTNLGQLPFMLFT